MAHEGIFATSAECIAKMGANYDSTNVDESMINDFCAQAEGYINVATRRNWSDDYASLNEDVKRALSEAASDLVGIYGISYNMSGFTTRGEAESMITVLRDRALNIISILRDEKSEEFIDGET